MATYEYSTIVRVGAVGSEALSGSSKDQASMALLHSTGWMAKETESLLDRHQDGGWEIVSLDQLMVQDGLLVSFVLRKEPR